MKIYTVVGRIEHGGFYDLGPSFSDETKALEFKDKCEAHEKIIFSAREAREWRANHPMSVGENMCYGNDSYDVIEHELIGGV